MTAHRPTRGQPLTQQQRDVLTLAATELTYLQIGARLHISEETVQSRMRVAFGKLGVTGRLGAVITAARLGQITIPGLAPVDRRHQHQAAS